MKFLPGKNSNTVLPWTGVVLAGMLTSGLAVAFAPSDRERPVAETGAVTAMAANHTVAAGAKTSSKTSAKRTSAAKPDCDASRSKKARKFPNGRIPSRYLCALPQKGHKLRADAALAFYKLNAAYKKHFGTDMCVTSSYRPYSKQKQLYATMPSGMAARPGTSNHGWGRALDLCGGVQNDSSSQFKWMEKHSKKYGWFHPAWAYSNPYEPWHWEYGSE